MLSCKIKKPLARLRKRKQRKTRSGKIEQESRESREDTQESVFRGSFYKFCYIEKAAHAAFYSDFMPTTAASNNAVTAPACQQAAPLSPK